MSSKPDQASPVVLSTRLSEICSVLIRPCLVSRAFSDCISSAGTVLEWLQMVTGYFVRSARNCSPNRHPDDIRLVPSLTLPAYEASKPFGLRRPRIRLLIGSRNTFPLALSEASSPVKDVSLHAERTLEGGVIEGIF